MSTDPFLRLNRQQVVQMLTHCRAYRSALWGSLLPSPERNQTLRSVQALQGRLEQLLEESQQTDLILCLSAEEQTLLKQLFAVVTQHYATAPPSDRRTQVLGELASLRLLVERTLRQMQTLSEGRRRP